MRQSFVFKIKTMPKKKGGCRNIVLAVKMIKPAAAKIILAVLREITITKITVLRRILLTPPHTEF